MVAKITGLTHKRVIQLHLVVESCTISRQPVQKLLDIPSYNCDTVKIIIRLKILILELYFLFNFWE